MEDEYQVKKYEVKLHPSDDATTTVVLFEDYKIVEDLMVKLTDALKQKLDVVDAQAELIKMMTTWITPKKGGPDVSDC